MPAKGIELSVALPADVRARQFQGVLASVGWTFQLNGFTPMFGKALLHGFFETDRAHSFELLFSSDKDTLQVLLRNPCIAHYVRISVCTIEYTKSVPVSNSATMSPNANAR